MSRDSERSAFWDDELEQLSTYATGILGDEIVAAAVESAFRQLRRDRNPVLSFEQLRAALKDELRRLVRPH